MFRASFRAMSKKLPPAVFHSAMKARGFESFYGVPDSLLKDICAFITENVSPENHVITANEGNAVAMAAGYHLATGKVPVVYMQNSGFGNTINPLLSLTHREVYQIPMLLLVGWRGDPHGKKDEPQHVAQGRLMKECLDASEVPFTVLEPTEGVAGVAEKHLDAAAAHFAKHGTPYCILIKRDTFDEFKMKKKVDETRVDPPMSREAALEVIIGLIGHTDIVVSTTGMPSREVFEIRAKAKAGHHRDFLTVGCMGHCSSIAAGIAMSKPDRNVVVIDGDGASLMHLGAYAINGGLASTFASAHSKVPRPLLSNMKHIVINNGAHDSVGGQPTVGLDVSLSAIAKASGYHLIRDEPVIDAEGLVSALHDLNATEGKGPCFLEVLVKKGNRKDIGRPTTTPIQNKVAFMDFIQKSPAKL